MSLYEFSSYLENGVFSPKRQDYWRRRRSMEECIWSAVSSLGDVKLTTILSEARLDFAAKLLEVCGEILETGFINSRGRSPAAAKVDDRIIGAIRDYCLSGNVWKAIQTRRLYNSDACLGPSIEQGIGMSVEIAFGPISTNHNSGLYGVKFNGSIHYSWFTHCEMGVEPLPMPEPRDIAFDTYENVVDLSGCGMRVGNNPTVLSGPINISGVAHHLVKIKDGSSRFYGYMRLPEEKPSKPIGRPLESYLADGVFETSPVKLEGLLKISHPSERYLAYIAKLGRFGVSELLSGRIDPGAEASFRVACQTIFETGMIAVADGLIAVAGATHSRPVCAMIREEIAKWARLSERKIKVFHLKTAREGLEKESASVVVGRDEIIELLYGPVSVDGLFGERGTYAVLVRGKKAFCEFTAGELNRAHGEIRTKEDIYLDRLRPVFDCIGKCIDDTRCVSIVSGPHRMNGPYLPTGVERVFAVESGSGVRGYMYITEKELGRSFGDEVPAPMDHLDVVGKLKVAEDPQSKEILQLQEKLKALEEKHDSLTLQYFGVSTQNAALQKAALDDEEIKAKLGDSLRFATKMIETLQDENFSMAEKMQPSVIEEDLVSAAWRTAGSQLVKLSRDSVAEMIASKISPDDAGARVRISQFMRTELGASLFAGVLSVAVWQHDRLSQELRVQAMSGAADFVADLVTGPLRAILVKVLAGENNINPAAIAACLGDGTVLLNNNSFSKKEEVHHE